MSQTTDLTPEQYKEKSFSVRSFEQDLEILACSGCSTNEKCELRPICDPSAAWTSALEAYRSVCKERDEALADAPAYLRKSNAKAKRNRDNWKAESLSLRNEVERRGKVIQHLAGQVAAAVPIVMLDAARTGRTEYPATDEATQYEIDLANQAVEEAASIPKPPVPDHLKKLQQEVQEWSQMPPAGHTFKSVEEAGK